MHKKFFFYINDYNFSANMILILFLFLQNVYATNSRQSTLYVGLQLHCLGLMAIVGQVDVRVYHRGPKSHYVRSSMNYQFQELGEMVSRRHFEKSTISVIKNALKQSLVYIV